MDDYFSSERVSFAFLHVQRGYSLQVRDENPIYQKSRQKKVTDLYFDFRRHTLRLYRGDKEIFPSSFMRQSNAATVVRN